MPTPSPWKNRIVGHGEEAPDQLLASPWNWRIHAKAQQDALSGVLDEIGWIQSVIVSKRTGHVVDGHLRVALAISKNEPSVPVVYVDLDEHEEKLALLTLDPLSAMAATDAEQLDALLQEVSTGDAAVQAMLADLAESAGVTADLGEMGPPDLTPGPDGYKEQYGVIVICGDESEQEQVYETLKNEGYTCRVVTT